MSQGTLTDSFGRVHRDLRISVTDRCNFRCTYCMPAEGMDWHPRSELLTFEELRRVAGTFVERYGFDSIRLTGASPPCATGSRSSSSSSPRSVPTSRSPPTAPRSRRRPPSCAPPGSGASTCRSTRCGPSASPSFTRRDELPAVLDGIRAAVSAGFDPVKVNVVVVRG
ncbi:MAG: hypothetical protein R2711_06525 [Acidimicrobiales bacterium]